MSYDHKLLCERISLRLRRNPNISLWELCKELRVSRRTMQQGVIAVKGERFSDLREDLLLARMRIS